MVAAIDNFGYVAGEISSFAEAPTLLDALNDAVDTSRDVFPPLTDCELEAIIAATNTADQALTAYINRAVSALAKRAVDPAVDDIKTVYDQFVLELYRILTCEQLLRVQGTIDEVYRALFAAGAAGSQPPFPCQTSSSAASHSASATGSTSGVPSTIITTTTYITTCPVCTGTHVVPPTTVSGTTYPATTITKVTTVTTECPLTLTTYVTTCPVCTGTHVVPATTVSGTLCPESTVTKATTVTTYCPIETAPVVPGTTTVTKTYTTTCPECTEIHTKPASTVSGKTYPATTMSHATVLTTTYVVTLESVISVVPHTPTVPVGTEVATVSVSTPTTVPVAIGLAANLAPSLAGVAAGLVGLFLF